MGQTDVFVPFLFCIKIFQYSLNNPQKMLDYTQEHTYGFLFIKVFKPPMLYTSVKPRA